MNEQNEIEPGQLQNLAQVFREQLVACLEECARGRRGLFSSFEHLGDEHGKAIPCDLDADAKKDERNHAQDAVSRGWWDGLGDLGRVSIAEIDE